MNIKKNQMMVFKVEIDWQLSVILIYIILLVCFLFFCLHNSLFYKIFNTQGIEDRCYKLYLVCPYLIIHIIQLCTCLNELSITETIFSLIKLFFCEVLIVLNSKKYKSKYPNTIWWIMPLYYEWIMKKQTPINTQHA